VGDEHQPRALTSAQSLDDRVDDRLEEARVVPVGPQPVEHRRPLARVRRGVGEVLAVLPARGVRRVGARGEAGGPGDAIGSHPRDDVGEVGVPVAVAPVDGDVDAAAGQVVADRVEQRTVQVVDGRPATEEEVVLADLLQPLAGDPAAARDVLQERHDVLGLLGPAEGDQQEGVVRRDVGGAHVPIVP
jgi:hypothetical protein